MWKCWSSVAEASQIVMQKVGEQQINEQWGYSCENNFRVKQTEPLQHWCLIRSSIEQAESKCYRDQMRRAFRRGEIRVQWTKDGKTTKPSASDWAGLPSELNHGFISTNLNSPAALVILYVHDKHWTKLCRTSLTLIYCTECKSLIMFDDSVFLLGKIFVVIHQSMTVIPSLRKVAGLRW